MRRKANEEEELDALFRQYALALSFFERWQLRGVESTREIKAVLSDYGPDRQQEQLDWLREQIEMRVIGLGWHTDKPKWFSASDENIGTVQQLTDHLDGLLKKEAQMRAMHELPSKMAKVAEACPAPQMQRKTFKSLGTPTVQADALSKDRTDLTAAEDLRSCNELWISE